MNSKEIVLKWYNKLCFPKHYDEDFYRILESYEIDKTLTIDNYDLNSKDGKKNFLFFLYFCEETERIYKEKGISTEILLDTLADIPRWLDIWSGLKGELYLGELDWLSYHLKAKLFKLGRLQFCFSNSYEFPKIGVKKGDAVVDTHIPAAGPLDIKECQKSFDFAREFFAKYFPEKEWKVFTCHSWLLGEDLKELLNENSNILKFQKLFTIDSQHETDSILSYTFRWKIKREEINDVEVSSPFTQKIKEKALSGGVFHGGLGYIIR